MGVSISETGMQPYFFYSLWQLVKWFLMYVITEKCLIAKIIREENIICNQFKHFEKEHLTYLNTLMQDLGETIFVYAVTLIMSDSYIVERKLYHLMLKLEFIGF